jgi:hypothetical protein
MPKIKNPCLINTTFHSYQKVYEVDVEGKKVIATYTYDGEEEHRSGWNYNLRPCYVGLDEDEIYDLEEEFYEMLCETTTAGNLNKEIENA